MKQKFNDYSINKKHRRWLGRKNNPWRPFLISYYGFAPFCVSRLINLIQKGCRQSFVEEGSGCELIRSDSQMLFLVAIGGKVREKKKETIIYGLGLSDKGIFLIWVNPHMYIGTGIQFIDFVLRLSSLEDLQEGKYPKLWMFFFFRLHRSFPH